MNKNVSDALSLNDQGLSQPLHHEAETTLEHVLNIMEVLTQWLVRSGVGYTEFTSALKPVFYNGAIQELERIHQKKTDSAISLLSGMNRRDISGFRQNNGQHQQLVQDLPMPVSVPARVIGGWISKALPERLPIQGETESFESLVRNISTEKHPRSILLELKRLGMIVEEAEHVVLQTGSFTPEPKMDESKQLFAANISDHLAAGIHNLMVGDDAFMEQAIFADELTPESILHLKQLSVQKWNTMAKEILALAIERCEMDNGSEQAKQRFRLGIYQYDDKDLFRK